MDEQNNSAQVNGQQPQSLAPSSNNIKYWVIGAVLVAIIGCVAFFYITNKKRENPSVSNEPTPNNDLILAEGSSLQTLSKIKFPGVASISAASEKDIPKEMNLFVLPNATSKSFNTIAYEKGGKGFRVEYMLENASLVTMQNEIGKLVTPPGTTPFWMLQQSAYASQTGFREYLSANGNQMLRVVFIQKDKNLEIVVQTSFINK